MAKEATIDFSMSNSNSNNHSFILSFFAVQFHPFSASIILISSFANPRCSQFKAIHQATPNSDPANSDAASHPYCFLYLHLLRLPSRPRSQSYIMLDFIRTTRSKQLPSLALQIKGLQSSRFQAIKPQVLSICALYHAKTQSISRCHLPLLSCSA